MNKYRMKLGRYVLVCAAPLVLVACTAPVVGGAVVAGGTAAPATVNALLTLGPSLLSDLGIGPTVISDTAKVACAGQAAINSVATLLPSGDAPALALASAMAGGLCAW